MALEALFALVFVFGIGYWHECALRGKTLRFYRTYKRSAYFTGIFRCSS